MNLQVRHRNQIHAHYTRIINATAVIYLITGDSFMQHLNLLAGLALSKPHQPLSRPRSIFRFGIVCWSKTLWL